MTGLNNLVWNSVQGIGESKVNEVVKNSIKSFEAMDASFDPELIEKLKKMNLEDTS